MNEQYGKWTALGKLTNTNKTLCKCECGTVKEVVTQALVQGRSTSCGCNTRAKLSAKARETQRKYALEPLHKNKSGYKGVMYVDSSYQTKLSVGGFKTAEKAHQLYALLKKTIQEFDDKYGRD